jgi:quinol monooxygenase YgiN
MIVEYIRYNVQPEQAEQFEQAYEAAAEPLLASENCLGCDVTQCSEDRTKYIVRIGWDSAEGHMKGFRGGPQFPRFFELVKPFFENIEEMRHYDIVGSHSRPLDKD